MSPLATEGRDRRIGAAPLVKSCVHSVLPVESCTTQYWATPTPCWDDSMVVLSTRQGPQPALIVRLAGESQVWAAPVAGSRQVWQVMAEPSGTRLAIGITNPAYQPAGPQTSGYSPLDLYIVNAGGQVVKVARAAYW